MSVRTLVRACGGALTATSANLAGQPPAFSAEDVQSYFSEGLDMIIDGGQAVSSRALNGCRCNRPAAARDPTEE